MDQMQPQKIDPSEQERGSSMPQPFIYKEDGALTLSFRIGEVQSRMREMAPDTLVLTYTRAMMAFLLLNANPQHIAMIGLGGGSIPKWCHRYLPHTQLTVVEINPQVIALRDHFHIPPDDDRFHILCEDGANYVAHTSDQPDVLMVDGFGADGQPPELCSQGFYDDCYRSLHSDGLMVVNLCDPDHQTYLARIRRSFQDRVFVLDTEDGENKVAFAGKGHKWWAQDEFPGPLLANLNGPALHAAIHAHMLI